MERAVHNTIIEDWQYDTSYQDVSHTAYGGFVSGKAVCDGYAKGLKLLLDSQGIKSIVVTGTASNGYTAEGHAWNMAKTADGWLYLDATFDDPLLVNPDGTYDTGNTTPYDTYYNKTTLPGHTPGTFDAADPFSSDCENYASMPAAGG